ncbi:FG-GAP repeat domain-containing protein [Paenibacillus arenilitoris]|uniref:VCBS repeat-containing protein n=1 Tax=Paenibacillus arenilitoris TaxID=2772299 RepID=A0A927CSG8_9BACL|nr:VCBS repeat-containing protein [Paenibacillus arenilitoris]MBD2872817.1 VCBS repeat-containing protein [Paenibacillus arenilitoris]
MALRFRKRKLDDTRCEACSVFDVNNDGIPDIVSGSYWYEGPDFTQKHDIGEVEAIGEYLDDFADYPLDVDGDGWTDIVTASFFGDSLRWRRNPGPAGGEWETVAAGPLRATETLRFHDIDGCGIPEAFANEIDSPQAFFKLDRQAGGKGVPGFRKVVIGKEPAGHGMGFADVNGDGRMDIVLSRGWLEQPEDPYGEWTFHPEFDLGAASIPILGIDVNGDGRCDLIYGMGHDYGLYWLEQGVDASGGRTWTRHEIDGSGSQFHDMQLVDLDGDGKLELVTGKRYRAHNDGDPGADDPVGLYYYKIHEAAFEKHVIDYGPAGEASGCGIYFWTHDLTGNGYPDIVAPGKDGLYLFENMGEFGEEPA